MAIITKTKWERELTEAESVELADYVATQVTAGTTDGVRYQAVLDIGHDYLTSVRIWNTSGSADAFVAFVNTFSPAPTLSEVQ